MRNLSFLHSLTCLLLLKAALASVPWSQKTYPSPEANSDVCGPRICDPDRILGRDGQSAVMDSIATFEETYRIPCHDESVKADQGQDGFKTQLAVALVNMVSHR